MPHSDQIRAVLEYLHSRIGELLSLCHQMLAIVVTLGGLFSVLMLSTFYLMERPEHLMRLQAFHYNYVEMSQIETDPANTIAIQEKRTLRGGKPDQHDPVWDGAYAGLGLGYAVGRNIPLIGWLVGPLCGAVLGYHLDSRL